MAVSTNSYASRLSCTSFGGARHPAILFLHGFMGYSADWTEVTATLEDGFYCVAPDLPGHGSSTGLPSEGYTMEAAASLVTGVLDALNVERPALVGYSLGGRLALYLALRYPKRFAGLFLESSSPGLKTQKEREARREMDELRARRLESDDFEHFLEGWYQQPLFASLVRDKELLEKTIMARKSNNPAELAKSLRGMGTGSQPSLWEELPSLMVPAYAVAGGVDEKFVGIGRRMEAESPMIDFVQIPGVGHNVHAEAPGAYIRLLRGFLESL